MRKNRFLFPSHQLSSFLLPCHYVLLLIPPISSMLMIWLRLVVVDLVGGIGEGVEMWSDKTRQKSVEEEEEDVVGASTLFGHIVMMCPSKLSMKSARTHANKQANKQACTHAHIYRQRNFCLLKKRSLPPPPPLTLPLLVAPPAKHFCSSPQQRYGWRSEIQRKIDRCF